jgi:flagellar protein FlaI
LDDYLRGMGERMGRPVSESRPIVDAVLPDGSRINLIYSDDVSQRGASFTIRKFSDTPTSITQICKWGTMSTSVAAYLWICLQNGMSVFVCGETASGKTTSLNGILSFIKPKEKVFTAEDTPEVRPPQPLWQQLVTRSSGPVEGRVEMFDLLKAALRSRPNYIIVGEIRGAEGAVAFQAMQTGHPCIATFHASSVQKMIQRFTSDPINVPATFMDNLNVCMIQMAVYNKGRMLRRVLAIEEIEGYNDQAGGVLTRRVFNWDPVKDVHNFRGRNNSYILEQKIAEKAGYADKREIYKELDLRTRILDRMIQLGIYDYYEVNRIIARFNEEGVASLPFKL